MILNVLSMCSELRFDDGGGKTGLFLAHLNFFEFFLYFQGKIVQKKRNVDNQ